MWFLFLSLFSSTEWQCSWHTSSHWTAECPLGLADMTPLWWYHHHDVGPSESFIIPCLINIIPWERGEAERDSGRCDVQFNVHPRLGTHIDESPCLWKSGMIVYSWIRIQTQARQLRASVRISRLSSHDVAIHCFVTTENIFFPHTCNDLIYFASKLGRCPHGELCHGISMEADGDRSLKSTHQVASRLINKTVEETF